MLVLSVVVFVLEFILELLSASEFPASPELLGGGRVDFGVAGHGAIFDYEGVWCLQWWWRKDYGLLCLWVDRDG